MMIIVKAAKLIHGNLNTTEGDQTSSHMPYVSLQMGPNILHVDDTGQNLYTGYVTDRFNGNVSLRTLVKKQE